MAETRRIKKAETVRTNLFIERKLWRALRVRAIEEDTTATALLNRLIADYVQPPLSRGKSKGA